LGLVPTAELPELDALAERLADWAEQWFDWAKLLPLLKTNRAKTPASDSSTSALSPAAKLEAQANGAFPWQSPASEDHPQPSCLAGNDRAPLHPIIAVAYDRAFNFYYADNLDLLRQCGAELVFWSPLEEALPAPIHGLYLGGGFPELFAQQLSQNRVARSAVKTAIESGLPTYAECGGLMYLAEQLVDFADRAWEMVGVLPTIAYMDQRLTLGYRRAVLLQNSPLLPAGAVVWGHEFHRSVLTTPSAAPLYRIQGYDPQSPFSCEGWRVHQVHASYVHVHWGANLTIPANFVRSCLEYGQCSQPSGNHSDLP
jgi:cobyrinic acid a,c-diamide synthase